MSRRVVAFTVSGQRERYLHESLSTWLKARGLKDWHFLFCLEPCRRHFPVAEFTQWVHRVFPSAEVVVNDQWFGCMRNTRAALDRAFGSGADFAVLAEEDIKVSADVLEYFSWAAQEYEDDEEVAAVCAHAKNSASKDSAAVTRVRWFNPLLWGTWAVTWNEFVRPGWGGIDGNGEAWDTNLRRQVIAAGRSCIFPVRSRALHIGELSTLTPGAAAEYLYKLSASDCWYADYGTQTYHEAPFTELPELVV